MSKRKARLSDEEIAKHLDGLPGWKRDGDCISRTFQFPNFVEAFGWMTSVALVAEKMDHHPEWKNVYGKVHVELQTHDSGGITELDLTLAEKMSELAGSRSAS